MGSRVVPNIPLTLPTNILHLQQSPLSFLLFADLVRLSSQQGNIFQLSQFEDHRPQPALESSSCFRYRDLVLRAHQSWRYDDLMEENVRRKFLAMSSSSRFDIFAGSR
jgi:hypothetical protein